MTRFSSRDFRFPITNGSTGEDEEDTTSFSEARQQQRELLTETLDEQDETFSEQRQEQRQELTDELQDEEEDEEPAPLASSIDDLQAAADPEAFDRTFRIEKSDVPQAIEDRNPIPFPWEGIPRVAMVFNFNYVWDDQEEEWVRDEGNGIGPYRVLDKDTVSIPANSTVAFQTGVTDGQITPFVIGRFAQPPPGTGDSAVLMNPEFPNFTGIHYRAIYRESISPSQWVVSVSLNHGSPVDFAYRFGEIR